MTCNVAGREAYVTLCTNSVYVPGALALGASLRQSATERDLVVIVTESLPAYYRYDRVRILASKSRPPGLVSQCAHTLA